MTGCMAGCSRVEWGMHALVVWRSMRILTGERDAGERAAGETQASRLALWHCSRVIGDAAPSA